MQHPGYVLPRINVPKLSEKGCEQRSNLESGRYTQDQTGQEVLFRWLVKLRCRRLREFSDSFRETIRKGSRVVCDPSVLLALSTEIELLRPVSPSSEASARGPSGLFGRSQRNCPKSRGRVCGVGLRSAEKALFRPFRTLYSGQIHARSVALTPFRTVSLPSWVNNTRLEEAPGAPSDVVHERSFRCPPCVQRCMQPGAFPFAPLHYVASTGAGLKGSTHYYPQVVR
jgi:hypothetical protein